MKAPGVFKGRSKGLPTRFGDRAMKARPYITLVLLAAALPISVAAQQDPAQRLSEVLPAAVVDQVMARVESARENGLPAQPLTNLALEGVVKGRSGDEVLAALDVLLTDMGRAREALEARGSAPDASEIQAATTALRMGIDGSAVSALARSGPPGRSLTIPLLVMGGLAQRGLPSDQALAAVSERLAARAGDAELLGTFGGPAGGPGGIGPDGAPSGQGRGNAGPPAGAGPSDGANAPGRGRGRGGGPPGS